MRRGGMRASVGWADYNGHTHSPDPPMTPTLTAGLLTALAAFPTPANVRAAADRALPLLVKAAAGHVEQQTCFACHNQALPMLAFHRARGHGFAVKDEDLKEQTDFIAEFLGAQQGEVQEGRRDRRAGGHGRVRLAHPGARRAQAGRRRPRPWPSTCSSTRRTRTTGG